MGSQLHKICCAWYFGFPQESLGSIFRFYLTSDFELNNLRVDVPISSLSTFGFVGNYAKEKISIAETSEIGTAGFSTIQFSLELKKSRCAAKNGNVSKLSGVFLLQTYCDF